MKKITLCTFLLFTATLFSLFSAGYKDVSYNTVMVSGTGTITMKSDTANILLAVVTTDEDASLAASKNAELMSQVQNAVIALGIEREDISTQNYSLYENYRNSRDENSQIKEYRASNNVSIIVRDISLVGLVIDAALKSGANQLSNVSFSSSKTKEAYNEARKLAVEDAYNKALFLATETGRKLGKTIRIEEASASSPRNYGYENSIVMAKAEITPISAEDSNVTIQLNIVYELK